jgi:hypothetical protein
VSAPQNQRTLAPFRPARPVLNTNAVVACRYETCLLLVYPPVVVALAALAASCALAGESLATRFAVCGVDMDSIVAACSSLLSIYSREEGKGVAEGK